MTWNHLRKIYTDPMDSVACLIHEEKDDIEKDTSREIECIVLQVPQYCVCNDTQ